MGFNAGAKLAFKKLVEYVVFSWTRLWTTPTACQSLKHVPCVLRATLCMPLWFCTALLLNQAYGWLQLGDCSKMKSPLLFDLTLTCWFLMILAFSYIWLLAPHLFIASVMRLWCVVINVYHLSFVRFVCNAPQSRCFWWMTCLFVCLLVCVFVCVCVYWRSCSSNISVFVL